MNTTSGWLYIFYRLHRLLFSHKYLQTTFPKPTEKKISAIVPIYLKTPEPCLPPTIQERKANRIRPDKLLKIFC